MNTFWELYRVLWSAMAVGLVFLVALHLFHSRPVDEDPGVTLLFVMMIVTILALLLGGIWTLTLPCW